MVTIAAAALKENNKIIRYIKNRGWKYIGEYSENLKVDVVVLSSLASAQKELKNFPSFLAELFSKNIEVALIKEGIDSLSDRSTFLLKILEFSQVITRNEKIKRGLERRVRKGKHPGFPAPYGYTYSSGRLVIERREFWHVKKIFSLYREGKSLSEIAEILNSKNIPTKRGRKWKKQTIAKILSNPIYCGYLKWNNLLVKGSHRSIISEKEYEEALSRLKGTSYRPVVNDAYGFQSLNPG